MSRFNKLREFEERFEGMSVKELERWKVYWTQHANALQPKIGKQAMKRVHDIDKALQQRLRENASDSQQIA